MGAPTSIIKICSGVMLNNSYQHTIWFDNATAQKTYFEGKVVKTFPSYTYLRKSWNIKVDATMAQATGWTYLFFKNSENGKTYYYFINNIEYVNDNTVELFLELDVMQTYLEEYTLASSFVDREHSATDAIGGNIVDESLELGELIESDGLEISLRDMCVLILSTLDLENTTEDTDHTVVRAKVDNVFSGLGVYAVEESKFTALATKLGELDGWGKSDCIVSMWMYPKQLVELASDFSWGDGNTFKQVSGTTRLEYDYNTKDTLTRADGVTVRNNKLFTYPFNFLYATNHCGNSAVYPFEKFYDRTNPTFYLCGALSAEASCKLHPKDYKLNGYEAGITMGSYPTCAWNQDVYKLWLAQNQNQNNHATKTAQITMATGAMAAVGSLAMGNVAGAVGGVATAYHGYNQIEAIMAQKRDMEIQPPQSKGGWSANVNIAQNKQNFMLSRKHVDDYHTMMLDQYFDMYGYKTQLVKIPNRNVRENYTYTKTIGCNVYGNICTDDLTKIKTIFDNGITFWKQGDLIGNYSLSNKCLLEVNNE